MRKEQRGGYRKGDERRERRVEKQWEHRRGKDRGKRREDDIGE